MSERSAAPDGRGASPGGMRAVPQWRVRPLLALGLVALLVGLWAGLARVGWDLPWTGGSLMLRHGGLMVAGFVATVILVERAVALGAWPAFVAPACGAAAAVALVVGAPDPVAPALATAAGVTYAANMLVLVKRHAALPFVVMLAGAILLVGGALVWWDGGGMARVVPWWIGFLALTVGAERLDIMRFQRFSPAGRALGAATLALAIVGPLLTLADLDAGLRVLGAGLVGGTAWLARRDIARRTVRTDGVARFVAAGILAGYAWLAVTGVLLGAWGLPSGLRYDATIHVFFVGFVLGAILAHEPIIVPSVTGTAFRYSPLLYLPLVLLHGSLIWRVLADLAGAFDQRRAAALIQVVAILLFLAVSAWSVIAARRGAAPARPRGAPSQPPRAS